MKTFIYLIWIGLVAIPFGTAPHSAAAAALQSPFFVGYFQSWADRADAHGTTGLARVASYVSVVDLGFMKPDAAYHDGYDLAGTGLDFPYSGRTLLAAIAELRQRNPKTRIMIGVGSSAYRDWAHLDTDAIARFVKDFGLDGVDMDYEKTDPHCRARPDGDIACADDANLIAAIEAMRRAIPRPLLLSLEVGSVGAYDPAQWKADVINGSRYNGYARQPLSTPAVRADIDFLNLMAYDSGNHFDPLTAAHAYRALYPGPIAIGVEPAPENSGDHVYTMDEVVRLATAVKREHLGGMMLYALQKPPSKEPGQPDSQAIAQRICAIFGLGECAQALY